jgi:hypothetical protein
MPGIMDGTEGSPQPRMRRPQLKPGTGEAARRAKNNRQREAAEKEAAYERRRVADMEKIWGRQW